MKKILMIVAVIVFAFAVVGQAAELKKPVHLRLASQDLGSAWYVYGANFGKLWRAILPKGSTIDVLPYGGGVANSLVLQKGDCDLAFSFTTVGNWAVEGKMSYTEPIKEIMGMVHGLDRYYLAIIATKRSGITFLDDVFKKKQSVKVVSQPMGSTSEYSMRILFDAYGFSYDDIRSWGGSVTPTATGVAKGQIIDGKADLWIQLVTRGHPAVSEAAMTSDLVFLSANKKVMEKMASYGYEETILPAKIFRGQDTDIPILGWSTILTAHRDLDPDLVYVLTKTIVENKDTLVKAHAGFKNFRPENAWNTAQYGLKLHPGAERYYREKGMIK